MLPTPRPDVVFQRIDDGAVLFSPSTEVYFGLNEVGARVWELLPPQHDSLDAVCTVISREYPDADEAMIRADVGELLDQLLHEGLVAPTATAGTRGAGTP